MDSTVQKFAMFVRLYPDVVRPAAGAVACLSIAIAAGWAERRRLKRRKLDSVGFMPWTTISVVSLFIGLACVVLAGRYWLAG